MFDVDMNEEQKKAISGMLNNIEGRATIGERAVKRAVGFNAAQQSVPNTCTRDHASCHQDQMIFEVPVPD